MEEFFKALGPLILLSAAPSLRRERWEWLLACAASGAGLGVAENLLNYVTLGAAPMGALVVMRSGTLVHIVGSMMVGSAGGPGPRMALMWLAASLLHSAWNALALSGASEFLPVFWLAILVGAVVWVGRIVRSFAAPGTGRKSD